MSDSIFPPRKKRQPMELNLTAMIDVFSMIVIFLIFGTIFGATDIVVPTGLEIPKSVSKEGLDSAPKLLIHEGKVTFSLSPEVIPLSAFKAPNERKQLQLRMQPVMDQYKERRKGTAGSGSTPINLVADQGAPYEEVYDVISAFRELGFDSIYFVATGGKNK
ncbi:MAG: biopolymer transporter ExbD [Bdellovibrionales bacterium]|nr:biopolymer transporter ExbD [Oligoflexia bacterium]